MKAHEYNSLSIYFLDGGLGCVALAAFSLSGAEPTYVVGAIAGLTALASFAAIALSADRRRGRRMAKALSIPYAAATFLGVIACMAPLLSYDAQGETTRGWHAWLLSAGAIAIVLNGVLLARILSKSVGTPKS